MGDKAIEVLGETLQRVRTAGRRHFFTTSNCWELFGVDFLIEGGSGRVLLLEINPAPSLAMYSDRGVNAAAVRDSLLGPDPLKEALPAGWRPVPIGEIARREAP